MQAQGVLSAGPRLSLPAARPFLCGPRNGTAAARLCRGSGPAEPLPYPAPSSGCSPGARTAGRAGGEMNTVLSRANSLFAFSLSVMAALTFGCFITTAFKERSVPVSIAVSRVTL